MFAFNAGPVRPGEHFMCIPPVQNGREVSFEECRIEDYLKAYIAIGRPPAPVPQVPTAAHERAALGLPPLFEPNVVEVAESSHTPTTPAAPAINGTSLNGPPPPMPAVHVFRPTAEDPPDAPRGSKVYYQNISCQPEFQWWSPEELRLSAYAKGQVFVSVPPPLLTPALPNGHSASPIAAGESMMNVSCEPQYSKHSPEELRLVFLRAGRELTSDEIIAQNAYLRLQ